ncbi:hypothetical protein CRUP_036113 [Coryphaenoides rupestris]|nr:hypothetical protein CRUP_036113 [Coryphaenoides rupestris]
MAPPPSATLLSVGPAPPQPPREALAQPPTPTPSATLLSAGPAPPQPPREELAPPPPAVSTTGTCVNWSTLYIRASRTVRGFESSTSRVVQSDAEEPLGLSSDAARGAVSRGGNLRSDWLAGGRAGGRAGGVACWQTPCFQLLRIGSSAGGVARDLYTFRPALPSCVFRLGRAPELCDVTLEAASVSRIHAELHTQRGAGPKEEEGEDGGWTVHIKDRSSHGTWVNEVRLQPDDQWELSDGDTLSFGGQSDSPSSEFYFLFQKVKVRPLDFDAITIPKGGQLLVRTSKTGSRDESWKERRGAAGPVTRGSPNRATVILSSIGSLSKMKGSAWSFRKNHAAAAAASSSSSSSSSTSSSPPLATGISSLLPPSTPPPYPPLPPPPAPGRPPPSPSWVGRTGPAPSSASRSRRKSAHTVLLEDDSSDEPRQGHGGARRPFPAGTRTIGSYHGAVTNGNLLHPAHSHSQVAFAMQRDPDTHLVRLAPRGAPPLPRPHKTAASPSPTPPSSLQRSYSPAQRGRRRAHSSPVCSPLVVGGENYSLASPSLRLQGEEPGRGHFSRLYLSTSKRRGRPRKHPLPPRPSLPSPSSSSSSSSCSSSSSSSSSSDGSSSSSDDEGEGGVGGAPEPCAAPRCRLPQQDPVQWIQCDVCDGWFHLDCLPAARRKGVLADPNADFHCGCR